MDHNLVVLSGRLAAPVETRTLDSGTSLLRYLVTVRTAQPHRRVDVLPVTVWDPPHELATAAPGPGNPIWVAGMLQRRFWEGGDGRRSRIEVVATSVSLREAAGCEPFASAEGAASG